MPYFSFSLKENLLKNIISNKEEVKYFKCNKTYFSKNTKLWKFLRKKNNTSKVIFCKYEKRDKIVNIGKSILFCLPPSIGLGDVVEYGLALNSICNSEKINDIGVGYVGRFSPILMKYFNFNSIYSDIIEEKELEKYDTIFHLSLEIKALKYQKYTRSDIELEVIKHFKLKKIRQQNKINTRKITKITIFPISQSPLRSMSASILNGIISNFSGNILIEVVLDKSSLISKYLEKNINIDNVKILKPENITKLLRVVESIQFGIFIDSGPLHIAKILQKKGLLIITSVSSQVLLNEFNTINIFENNYKSQYCEAPCGLTNIFNFENKIGCFDSLKLDKKKLYSQENLNSLQRGSLKNNYLNFITNPVECINKINIIKLNQKIKQCIEKN